MASLLYHAGENHGFLEKLLSFFGGLEVVGWIGLIAALIFLVGLIATLILLVVWAIRRAPVPAAKVSSQSGQPTADGNSSAKEILQAQYARGEITREQYELKKQAIG